MVPAKTQQRRYVLAQAIRLAEPKDLFRYSGATDRETIAGSEIQAVEAPSWPDIKIFSAGCPSPRS